MKNSIITLCACIAVAIAAFLLLSADWKNNNPVVANLNVALGRGAGNPCGSSGGLCSFALASSAQRSTDESQAKAYVNETGNFVLEISKATISVATSERQFQNSKFSLSEDFVVPAEVLSAVNANRSAMTLLTGDYSVVETAEMYKITFDNSGSSSLFY